MRPGAAPLLALAAILAGCGPAPTAISPASAPAAAAPGASPTTPPGPPECWTDVRAGEE